jgi:UDPglucose 6-dehydrogenase
MSAYENVARDIAKYAKSSKIIVEKSTVPVKTAQKIRQIFEVNKANSNIQMEVISNPEFLSEGTAIANLENPDRVIIGCLDSDEGKLAAETLASLYKTWISDDKLITTGLWSAELAKISSNVR